MFWPDFGQGGAPLSQCIQCVMCQMLCQSAYEHIMYHLCHSYNEPMQYPANQMQAAPCYQDVEYRRSNQVITRHIPQVCP